MRRRRPSAGRRSRRPAGISARDARALRRAKRFCSERRAAGVRRQAAPERPEYALFLLRRDYELYANLRPVRVFPGLEDASSLKPELVRGLDLVVVREFTGGIYYGKPKEQRSVDGVEEAVDTMIYHAPEIERIARVAFELARARRKRVTSVDKQNILETSRLWRRVVERGRARISRRGARASAGRQRRDAARAPPATST